MPDLIMSSRRRDNDTSMATILNYDNRDAQSQWSTVWSTTYVPGMDNAAGGQSWRRKAGRRRLQIGSLVLGALLTMHTRVTASALTGGYVVFMMTLVVAVIALANPMRHFEVYLGQWSISGPGRAFRIVPLLDGIGIAICINAIVRAINYCTIAAIAAKYVWISIRDDELPFTYCRDFDLNPYKPDLKVLRYLDMDGKRLIMETKEGDLSSTVIWQSSVLSNFNETKFRWINAKQISTTVKLEVCKETYPGSYPALYSTPPYNYFYVELVNLRADWSLKEFNYSLMILLGVVWITIWIIMITENVLNGRLMWNNTPSWTILIPWAWSIFLITSACTHMNGQRALRKAFRFGTKDITDGICDGFEVALYIHAASIGTELITGKGLNRYAAGHIDPALNRENVWHSFLVIFLACLNCGGTVLCASVGYKHPNWTSIDEMSESTLWIFPMYSKCASVGHYKHFTSTCIFLGLTVSYTMVAYVFLKTALHIIFEYRVKLVFREQLVVAALLLVCALLSSLYTTHGGLALLESVEALMSGVAMPLVCLLELIALLWVYRSRDFSSDLNVAMEDSMCSSRISIQWQIIPFLTLATLMAKIGTLINTELPILFMGIAVVPIACMLIALPLRALQNMYMYLHPDS